MQFFSHRWCLPHGCLRLRILRRLNAFPSAAAAVSALTQVSAGWGFPVIPAVHIQLFYHISVSSQTANECFACSNFICFTKLQCWVMAVSYFVSQSSGRDYLDSGLKSERIRMKYSSTCSCRLGPLTAFPTKIPALGMLKGMNNLVGWQLPSPGLTDFCLPASQGVIWKKHTLWRVGDECL